MSESIVQMKERGQTIVRTSLVGIGANAALAVMKLIVGGIAHSIAITSDAVNNLGDALSSLITIIGAQLAGKAPDKKHPFGYGRMEYLSTLIISVIILYAGITALVEAVKAIFAPEMPAYAPLTLILLAVGVLVKLGLSALMLSTGKKVKSDALRAAGTDQRMDAILSTATLVAAVLYLTLGWQLEAYLAAVIAVFLIRSGIESLKEALDSILGQRMDVELSQGIRETMASVEGVEGVYDLIFADYGPDRVLATAHLEVADTLTAAQVDGLIRRVTDRVYQAHHIPVIALSIYARNTGESEAARLEKQLRDILRGHPQISQMHGFYVDEGQHILRFDLVVPLEEKERNAVYATALQEAEAAFPAWRIISTLDADYSD